MSFSFSRTKKEKIIAILDIGSASVGGALVSLKNNSSPEVLVSFREDMVFQDNFNLARFTSSMLVSLEHVLSKMNKSVEPHPDTFFCILSSPWYESETKKIEIKKTEPFVVTHKILEDLIAKEVSLFSDEIKKGNRMKSDAQIIDVKNIQIKLNGYKTSNPYGKSVENIKVALFIGLSSKKILKEIEGKISRIFCSSKIKFSTFSLTAFSTVRDIFTDKNNFLLLDITGEVTDVTLVKDGVLIKTTQFPIGKNFLMRRIASNMNTSLQEAKSLLNIFNSNKINEATRIRIESILYDAQKDWLVLFEEAITLLSKESLIPDTIFFTADAEISDWCTESVKREEFKKFTATNEIFDVNFLEIKVLEKFCSFKEGVVKDPFIILEAIFADRNRDTF